MKEDCFQPTRHAVTSERIAKIGAGFSLHMAKTQGAGKVTDKATKETSEKLVALYTKYREILDAEPVPGQWMPYNWYELPAEMSVQWLPFRNMLDEYARELANIINDLTHHVHRLRAWHAVADKLSDEDKLLAAHELLEMAGATALGLPYAIKSRFAVAAGHLCHQANQAKDPKGWKDEFPEGNLYLHHIEDYGKGWKKFRRFVLTVEPIADKKFREASSNFRHSYNHGFSPHFLIGESGLVERVASKDGKVSYNIGSKGPLTMGDTADVLEVERDHCYKAFEAFQALVAELLDAIEVYDREHPVS